ncbi:MAG: acetylglutamate kinase [Planctomycetota bacterium]
MRILVKVGGAQLELPDARRALVRSVLQAREAGVEIVLVHGGGNQIRELAGRLSLPERYVDGLRVTDAATAEVVLMVLAGLVNKQLVAAFEEEGARAVGLCGADGSTFCAAPEVREVALGYVGSVARVDPQLVLTLIGEGYVPILSTVAPLAAGTPGARDRFYNVNADLAAGPLSKAFGASALLFLTDVPGVLDAHKVLIRELSPRSCAALRADGVIHGGMIPKVDAALAALAANPDALVKIAPSAATNAVLAALDPGAGTRFTTDSKRREPAWTSTSS